MHYRSVWSTFIIYSSSSCCPVRAVEPARPTIEVRVFWVVWVCARSMRTLRNISYICQCRQVRTSIIYHNRWSHRDLYSVRCVHPSKSTLLTAATLVLPEGHRRIYFAKKVARARATIRSLIWADICSRPMHYLYELDHHARVIPRIIVLAIRQCIYSMNFKALTTHKHFPILANKKDDESWQKWRDIFTNRGMLWHKARRVTLKSFEKIQKGWCRDDWQSKKKKKNNLFLGDRWR